jgi:hypothetical protein
MIYSSVMTIFGMAGLVGSVNIGMFITFRFFAGAGSWAYLAVSKWRRKTLLLSMVRN